MNDSQFPINYLGHNFKLVKVGAFICTICNVRASYYLNSELNDPLAYCQKDEDTNVGWTKLLSCDENIIKNIIE